MTSSLVARVAGLRRLACAFGCLVVALLVGGPLEASVWPSSHQRVAKALQSGDPSERRAAATKLLSLPPKLASGLARHALRDDDTEVRLAAARAAAALGLEGAGDEVVEWLSDRDARLRAAACELIEASPTPASVQALGRVLSDAQAGVRKAAAQAMGSSGLSDTVAPLLGHLDDGSAAVRLEVVRALGRVGDRRAVVPLVSKLQDQEADVRREAARALGQLGDARATATLMLALGDASLAVRVQALDALGRLRADEATAAIAALFAEGDDDSGMGSQAAQGPLHDAALRALGRIGSQAAIKLLVEALEREGPVPLDEARGAPVREALVLTGKAGLAALMAALDGSPSERLASASALAVGRLGDRQGLDAVVRAAQRGAVALDAALDALSELGDARALSFVLEHLDHPDPRVRQLVIAAASRLLEPSERDGRAVDVVRERVVNLRAPIGERIALVKLLGRTGSTRALGLLLPLARGGSKSGPVALKTAVVEALGTLGVSSPEVDDALLAHIGASSPRLRAAAATSLGRVGGDRAAFKLLYRLGVSAEQDRAALGVALSGALARSKSPRLMAPVTAALASAPEGVRDALFEGLGRMQTREAGALLATLRSSAEVDDRRKIAEALAGHPSQRPTLLTMLVDPDPTVRANAAWSLGKLGDGRSTRALVRALSDLDVAVAGNAAVALGRVTRSKKAASKKPAPRAPPTKRTKAPARDVRQALCAALSDYRPYVRAGGLTALAKLGWKCREGVVERMLRRDKSWRVRLAAARLLRARQATGGDAARTAQRALWRCAAEDRDAAVASRCADDPPASRGAHDVLVYVVPDGKEAPMARAPFALVLADGSMRLGVADRRGAIFERRAPGGTLELAVPAALAE
jgi:HEAT repeat protein